MLCMPFGPRSQWGLEGVADWTQMDPQLRPTLPRPKIAPETPVRSAIAADAEYAECGVEVFRPSPQPLNCLKSCEFLVAETEMS